MQSLNFDPQALKQGLVKHKSFFDETAKMLEMKLEAHGFQSSRNVCDDQSAPVQEDDQHGQNLALKEASQVRVGPQESKTVWLWAYCANSNLRAPHTQMEATDYVLDCDLSGQQRTISFQR